MKRALSLILAVALLGSLVGTSAAEEIRGDYLEARTCDIYTGPCFANAEVGLTGNLAIMAWSIDSGNHLGVDLTGLKVALAVRANDTLSFGSAMVTQPFPIKSVIVVDDKATAEQKEALVDFVKRHAEKVVGEVLRVDSSTFEMSVDHNEMVGILKVGKRLSLVTRKMAKGDCVCTNEKVFYSPLTEVDNAEPAYTLEGGFRGNGLGSRWTSINKRSAFLATFAY